MTRILWTSLTLATLLIACGGSATPTATPTPVEEQAMGEHGHDHDVMPAELAAFHDVLAPRWHMEDEAEKRVATCAAIDEFQTQGEALRGAATPENADGERWSSSVDELVSGVAQLRAACDDQGPEFAASFLQVHEEFHALMEQISSDESS